MTAFEWLWPAVAISVVDGDTLDVRLDRGFRDTSEMRVRLYGINTPERGQPGAADATQWLRNVVQGFDPMRPPPLTIRSVKPHDKYGRWLASIATAEIPDVAARMVELGLGVEYYGGAR
jgi:micrococcal nuclease